MPSGVRHFGPAPACVGGMGSVIRVFVEHRVGGDHVVGHPTWRPDSVMRTVGLTARAALKVARMPRGEVAHFHLSQGGSFLREGGLVMLARRRGLVTVVTIHGAKFAPFVRRRPRLVATVLRAADLVTCLDREAVDLVTKLAPGVPVELIPNPVQMDESAEGVDGTAEIVVFAGEIGYRKGADVLVRAWPSVAKRRPGARCIMVGPRTELSVPAIERLEVREEVGSTEMREILRAARVVALPSRAEGMPMTLTEAMGAGRPFVATPVGGVPELAKGGGMLVEVGDVDGLASRLTELLSDPALAVRIGEGGRRFCRETRSVSAIDRLLRGHYSLATDSAGSR
jgi:glycosyltransferase involved in cell wall biosynthesis